MGLLGLQLTSRWLRRVVLLVLTVTVLSTFTSAEVNNAAAAAVAGPNQVASDHAKAPVSDPKAVPLVRSILLISSVDILCPDGLSWLVSDKSQDSHVMFYI